MANQGKVSFVKRIQKFFKEIRSELKKVVWPTKSQLLNSTLTVFATCFLIGVIVWIADFLFNKIFNLVFVG